MVQENLVTLKLNRKHCSFGLCW